MMTRSIRAIFVILVVAGVFLLAHADTIPALALHELIEEVRLNNPEIQAQGALYEAAQARISSMRYVMDPMIGVEFGENMRMYSVTQQLPFPTKLPTLSKFAHTEAEQYKNLYLEKEQEIINRAKKGYAQLFLIHKKIETVEQSIAFLKQFFQIASQKYAVGKANQTDVLRAQVELAKAENDLLMFKEERKIAEARLNTLLNRNINAELGVPDEIDTSIITREMSELFELTKENQSGLRAFSQMLKKAEVMVSVARQTYLPDFTLRFTQQEMNHRFTDRKFMLGFTVPLWFWGKQSEMVREMDANLKMAKAHYQVMENMALLAVKEAKVKVDNNQRTLGLYRNSIIPQATANLRSALTAYQANQVDFLNLLESEKTLIQSELEYHRAQADFFVAIGDLEEAVGVDIIDR